MKTLIAIPARYGSTRFPGKPLAKIAGKEMLLRVWENAQKTAAKFEDCHAVVATDDERIADFCKSKNIACVMTSPDCPTGTDRVVEAAESFADKPEFVVNLQGDNPICPPWFVEAVIAEYYNNNAVETVTPVVNLSWEQLDKLRRGVPLDGRMTAPARVSVVKLNNLISELVIEIHEGRNRQIRRMCEAIGHPVKYLCRTRMGSLTLEGLEPGQWRYLTPAEIAGLK